MRKTMNEEEILNQDIFDLDFLREEHHVLNVVKPDVTQAGEMISKTKQSLDNHKFSCKLCGKSFKCNFLFEEHLTTHSDDRNFKCDQCDRTYKSRRSLYNHKAYAHATERPFQCEVCSKSFPTAFFLKKHSVQHSEERPYKCDRCSEAFKIQHILNNHIDRVHGLGGNFPCGLCGKILRHSDNFNNHLARHNNERKHVCDQCGTTFKVKGDLARHKKYVHANKPIKCEACPKTFTNPDYLQTHVVRMHSKEKPFKCYVCSKSFPIKHDLYQHKLGTHGEASRFPCAICGKGFKVLTALKRHLLRHSDERNFKCDQCDKAFKRKFTLDAHKSSVHATERPFRCEVCPKNFGMASRLKHSRKHEKKQNMSSVKTHQVQDHKFLDKHLEETETFENVDVKVEPVELYDPEVKQVVSDQIKVEMDVDVKQEPQDFGES